MPAGAIGLKAIFSAEDRGVTSTVVRMQTAVIGLTDSAGKGLGKLDAFSAGVAESAKTAALALGTLGIGLGTVAKNVIDTGADFEQAISAVGAVGLQSRAQIAGLEKQALELGATTVFSAKEVANAMENMARAGFKNQEIMAGVGGVLDAAAASGLEIAEVAGVVSNALKGMGLQADQASRVADVLALASSRTNSTIGSLGESMKNLAPVARQLNVPLEQAVASVALLQDVGLDASEAGTATATMLSKLAKPSKEAAAEMAALGVKFQDAHNNMLPLSGILEQFDKAAKKSGGNAKVLAFFTELVGLRGQKAAINLKDLFASGKVSSLTKELEHASGAAGKMATLRLDNFRGDVEQLGGAVDSLKIGLFDMQSGPLRGVVQGMTEWVEINGELIKSDVGLAVKEWTPLLLNFADGVKSAFEDAKPLVMGLGSAIGSVFGTKSESARMEAFLWGETIAKWGIRYIEFAAAVKVARIGIFVFGNATQIARGIAIAYNFTLGTLRAAVYAYQIATGVGSASTVALGGAMTSASVGANALTASAAGAEAGLAGMGATAGIALGPILAIAAAIGSVAAAAYNLYKFGEENGGVDGIAAGAFGFVGLGKKGWGLEGMANNVDDEMNRQAILRQALAFKGTPDPAKPWTGTSAGDAANALTGRPATGGYAAAFGLGPQAPAPVPGPFAGGYVMPPGMPPTPPAPPLIAQPRVPTPEEFHAMVQQELTVKVVADAGTTAEVVKKPKGAKVTLAPSGAP